MIYSDIAIRACIRGRPWIVEKKSSLEWIKRKDVGQTVLNRQPLQQTIVINLCRKVVPESYLVQVFITWGLGFLESKLVNITNINFYNQELTNLKHLIEKKLFFTLNGTAFLQRVNSGNGNQVISSEPLV